MEQGDKCKGESMPMHGAREQWSQGAAQPTEMVEERGSVMQNYTSTDVCRHVQTQAYTKASGGTHTLVILHTKWREAGRPPVFTVLQNDA